MLQQTKNNLKNKHRLKLQVIYKALNNYPKIIFILQCWERNTGSQAY